MNLILRTLKILAAIVYGIAFIALIFDQGKTNWSTVSIVAIAITTSLLIGTWMTTSGTRRGRDVNTDTSDTRRGRDVNTDTSDTPPSPLRRLVKVGDICTICNVSEYNRGDKSGKFVCHDCQKNAKPGRGAGSLS